MNSTDYFINIQLIHLYQLALNWETNLFPE